MHRNLLVKGIALVTALELCFWNQNGHAQQCGLTTHTVTCGENPNFDDPGWKRCVPKFCVLPEDFPNGRMSPDSQRISIGERVHLECDEGYVLSGSGSPSPRCLNNCSLESYQVCERIACSPVTDPQGNGELLNATVFFGDVVTVQCNEDYRSSESDTVFNHACDLSYTRTCQSNGVLTPAEARCIPVSCPPYDPTDRSLQCLDVTCGPAYGTVVGQVDSSDPTPLGGTVVITCFEGYRLRGETSNRPQCTGNCQYTTGHQACTPRLCPDPEVPANARAEATSVPFASATAITCNGGFVVRGSTPQQCNRSVHVTCQLLSNSSSSDIRLLPAVPSDLCVPAPCPRFVVPENALSIAGASDSPIHGQELTVTCKDGFRVGNLLDALAACDAPTTYTVQCLGCAWSQLNRPAANPLACLPTSCSPLAAVANGQVSPNASGVLFGSNAEVTCDTGFRINSEEPTAPRAANVTCLPACNYSAAPTCQLVKCSATSAPANGVLVIGGQEVVASAFTNIFHGEEIMVRCNAGFMLDGSVCQTETQSTCVDGVFSPQPTCTPAVCGCGFGLPCEAFRDDPNAVEGADAQANGSAYQVTCKEGFRAVEDAGGADAGGGVSCEAPRSYASECRDCTYLRAQRCARTSCGVYSAANATAASSGDVLSGGEVEVTCSLGFRPNSSEALAAVGSSRSFTATCGGDCAFGPRTECLPIKCAELPASNFSSVTAGVNELLDHGAEVTVTCDDGYYVAGSDACQQVFTVTCYDGGLINKQACTPITRDTCGCGVGDCPAYARLSTEASWEPAGAQAHGDQVTITCAAGYRAGSAGDAVAFCADPETRSATCSDCRFLSNQACLPLACPAFVGDPAIASFAPSGPVEVGNKVSGTCAPGFRYATTGTKTFSASCGADCAYFLDAASVCEPVQCAQYTLPANSESVAPHTASSRLEHEEVMRLRCQEGFTVAGRDCATEFNVTCSDAALVPSPAEPACVPARCGCGSASCPLWTPANATSVVFVDDEGVWSSGSIAHGTRVRLTCNSGFRPGEGAGMTDCTAPSRLEAACNDCVMDPDISCRPISCGPLQLSAGEANHSVVTVGMQAADGRVSVGTVTTAACPEAFRLGSRTASQPQEVAVECQSDCSFSQASVPACLRVNCPDFTLPSNSMLVSGSGDGWQGVPGDGPAGWMGTQRAGAVLNVTCNAGFMRASASAPGCERSWVIGCSNDGQLSGDGEGCQALICGCGSQGDCPAPTGEAAEHIESVSPAGTLSHGEAFNVTCAAGARAVDPAAAWSTCADPSGFSGRCSDCSLGLSSRCRPVRCGGYTTSDPNVASWSRPGIDEDDQIVTNGQALIVTCKDGYRAGGACPGASCDSSAPNSFSVACGSDCTYTAGQECKPVQCVDVPGVANSDSQAPQPADGRLYGAEVVVNCLTGFMPAGGVDAQGGGECAKELRLQCGKDGEWTAGECVPVTCTAPASGGGEGPIVVLGFNFSAACDVGYEFSAAGSPWGVCGEDCLLSPAVKSCDPVQCAPITEFHTSSPATVTAPPSAVAALTVEYPNLMTVTCGEGLVADPALEVAPPLPSCAKDLQLQCNADGHFNLVAPGTPPQLCLPAECPPFTSVDANALPSEATSSPSTYGSSITVLCKDGYKPSGSGGNATFQARCGLRDATGDACLWSVEQICEPIVCGRYSAPARATIEDPDWSPTREYLLGEQVSLRCLVGYMVAGTSCSKQLVDLCLPSGQFSAAQCVPVICPPLSQSPPPLPLPEGATRWPESSPDTSVTYSTSVELRCPTGTTPLDGGFRDGLAVLCEDDCHLDVGARHACVDTQCAPYAAFDFSGGVVYNPYFDTVRNLTYGENVTVECLPGFQLDDSDEYLIPGLEDLGSVTVKARKVFSVDRSQESTFSLDGDFQAVQIVVPQGSWPEGVNEPLSVTVFEASEAMEAALQNDAALDPQAKIGGSVVNYGPEGVTFDPPLRIALPLDSSVDFGSRTLLVHRFDSATGSWTPKAYPDGMQSPVDLAAGVVWAQTSSFSPYAVLALPAAGATTAAPATPAPEPTAAPTTTANASLDGQTSTTARSGNATTAPPVPDTTPAAPPPDSTVPPAEEEGGGGPNIPLIVGCSIAGLALLLCGVAAVYVQETRRRQEAQGKENLLSQRTGETKEGEATAALAPAMEPAQGASGEATRDLPAANGAAANGEAAQPQPQTLQAPPPVVETMQLQGMPTLFPPPTPAMAFYPGADAGYPGYGMPAAAAPYMSPDKLAWQPPDGLNASQVPLLEQDLTAWQPSSPEDVGQSTYLSALSHVAGQPSRPGDDHDGASMFSESTLRGTNVDGDPVRGHALEIASELAALIPPGWQLCEGCLQPTKIEWMTCPNCNQPLPHSLA